MDGAKLTEFQKGSGVDNANSYTNDEENCGAGGRGGSGSKGRAIPDLSLANKKAQRRIQRTP